MSYDKDNISTPGLGGDYEEMLVEVTDMGENFDNDSLLKVEDSPINGLKVIVLSLDWEITDQSMLAFGREIKKLKEMWSDEKVPFTLLKILGALGEYIRVAKDLSHPHSIKLFQSVYNNLEKVVLTPGIPEYEKQKIIISEFAKYNELKEELRRIKVSAAYESVGKRFDEISANGSASTMNIQETEAVPLESTVLGVPVDEEVGDEHETYSEIDLIPGVDGIIDNTSLGSPNGYVDESTDLTSATGAEGDDDQVIAASPVGKKGGSSDTEKEFTVERVDNVSFDAVDQRLDDFFEEDDVVADVPLETGVSLDEPEADGVMMLAVDDEVDDDGGSGAEIELILAEEDSLSVIKQSRDDFWGQNEVVASVPLEAGVSLDEPEADGLLMLAVDDKVDEDGETGSEIELFFAEEDSLSVIKQSLDDFFGEDEAEVAVQLEAAVSLDEPEADDVLMLAVDDDVDDDGGSGTDIEPQPAEEASVSAIDQNLDDFFGEDEAEVAVPLEAGVSLDEPEADDVLMLAVDDDVDDDGGSGTDIELQPAEDASVSAIDQSLDDFFGEDEAEVAVQLEVGVSLDEPEADDVLMLAVDDEVDDDDGSGAEIEPYHVTEKPASAPEIQFDRSFSYGEGLLEQEKFELHADQVHAIEALNTIILAINRELSEQGLQDFSTELIRLKALWESEKVLLIFLHLLESLGSHLQTMGEHMQPNTTQLLLSIFSKLEKAACVQKNDIIQHEMLLEAIKMYIKWNEKNIGAVLLPEQDEHEPVQNMIFLGSAEEMSLLEPID